MTTISDRITLIIKELCGDKNTELAKLTGTSEANIRNYIAGRQPKFDFLSKLVSNLHINADWLLTGNGDMLRGESASKTVTSVIYKSDPKDIAALADKQVIIDDKNKIIAMQEEKIRGLEAQLSTRPTGLYTAHSVGTTQEVEKPHK